MKKLINVIAYIVAHVVIASKDVGYMIGGLYYSIAYHAVRLAHHN